MTVIKTAISPRTALGNDANDHRDDPQYLERVLASAEPIEPPPPLVPVDIVRGIHSAPEDARYLVKPWLPSRTVTLLGAHGGAGKTTLALVLAAHIAAGRNFAGMPVEQGRVLFVSLEDEPSLILLRLRRVLSEYGFSEDAVVPHIRLLDGTEGYAALMADGHGYNATAATTAAFEAMRAESAGFGLVVIDNASDAFDANENQRRAVRSFMRALTQLARANDAAVVLLAHIDKAAARNGSQGNSYSGSTAWHNSARSRLAMLVEDDGRIVVEHEKLNVGRRADPLTMRITAEGIPRPAATATGPEAELVRAVERSELTKAFKAAHEAGINVPANLTPGAHSAMSTLATLPEYPARYQNGSKGRSDAARLLTAMKRERILIEEPYTKPNRHKSTRLVLAECVDPNAGGPQID